MKFEKRVKIVIIYVISVIWAVITIFPLVFSAFSSFKNNNEIYGNMFGLPEIFRTQNYIDAFTTAKMGVSLLNSVFISGSSTLLLLLVGSMASYVLARRNFRLNSALLLYFTMAIMIPAQCMLIPIVKIVSSVNGRNNYLTMIFIYVALNLPINIYLITSYMKTINKEIDESAIIDGCSTIKLLFKVLVPVSMPGISTAGIISFLFIYNELIYASVLLSKKTMYTVPVALLSFRGSMTTDLGPTFAAVVISIFPVIVIYLLFQEKIEKGLTAGAVKG